MTDFTFSPLCFVYILQCQDGSLYTGYTTSLCRRIRQHNQKKGARYTKSHAPVTLVYFELFFDRGLAMSREWQIKQKSRKEKLELVQSQHSFCLTSLQRDAHWS